MQLPDANTQVEEAKVRGDKFLQELLELRGRCKRLEARNQQLEPQIGFALEIGAIIEPPEWIDEWGVFMQRAADFRQRSDDELTAFRQWASRAAHTWGTIDALSADSRRALEEACRASLRDPGMHPADTYAITPLLTETLQLLREAPQITETNLFELKSADFHDLALWLDIVERLGRARYRRLRESGITLMRDRAQQLVTDPSLDDEDEDLEDEERT